MSEVVLLMRNCMCWFDGTFWIFLGARAVCWRARGQPRPSTCVGLDHFPSLTLLFYTLSPNPPYFHFLSPSATSKQTNNMASAAADGAAVAAATTAGDKMRAVVLSKAGDAVANFAVGEWRKSAPLLLCPPFTLQSPQFISQYPPPPSFPNTQPSPASRRATCLSKSSQRA